MSRFIELSKDIRELSRGNDGKTNLPRLVSSPVWLAKKATNKDKEINGAPHLSKTTEARLYFQRLLEAGYIFSEVFLKKEYEWKPKSDHPRVIDLGGDIGGFSALYWKTKAPNARITLVEANPATAATASENIQRNGYMDIEIINAAASEEGNPTILHLHKPGEGYHPSDFTGDRPHDPSKYNSIEVPGIKVSDIIGEEYVDLLKIDIEGAEGQVIRDLAKTNKMIQVHEIIMEFHNDPENLTNSFEEIMQTFKNFGFNIERAVKTGRKKTKSPLNINSIPRSEKLLFVLSARNSRFNPNAT